MDIDSGGVRWYSQDLKNSPLELRRELSNQVAILLSYRTRFYFISIEVRFAEPGDLIFEETGKLLKLVWKAVRIEELSIACHHPRMDTDGKAGKHLASIITEIMASSANTEE